MKMTATYDEIENAKYDEDVLNTLLERNRKFMLVSAYRACGHFVGMNDDEWSVSLLAFHEAVMSYDISRGNFRSFCSLVIRRRILDHEKRMARFASELNMDDGWLETDSEEDLLPLEKEIRHKLMVSGMNSEEIRRHSEIEEMQYVLEEYGFSFYDLASCSPTAAKTRKECALLIRTMTENEHLLEHLHRYHTLPVQGLCDISKVKRKTAERYRKYIIACVEILNGDYPCLQEYVRYAPEAER